MDWEGLALGLAMMGEAEQPCAVCGDVHDKHCETEDLGGYRDPAEDVRFA